MTPPAQSLLLWLNTEARQLASSPKTPDDADVVLQMINTVWGLLRERPQQQVLRRIMGIAPNIDETAHWVRVCNALYGPTGAADGRRVG